MTRESYYDMCDQLGCEPIEDEIPIELDDLPEEAQIAWKVYSHLADRFDSFNGNYFGKDISNLLALFELFGVVEKEVIFSIITLFNEFETKEINSKKK